MHIYVRSTVYNPQKCNMKEICLVWKNIQPILESFGVWCSNLLGIFRAPSFSLFSLQMLIFLLISVLLVLSSESGREKIHETQISQFYLFEDSKNSKIINKEMVMLFSSYYFSDYITCVMILNYSPMTNTNHLLAFFFFFSVYLINYISDPIILNLSL